VIYFDTSVLAAYYTPEERSAEAAAIIAKASYPVVSDLAVAELNVAIVRKEKLGFLPQKGAEAVFSLFDEHLRDAFLTIALETRHMEATRALAARTSARLRTLDALHLVIALEVEATLATFDDRLHEAARAVGLPVLPQTLREAPGSL
jgi:predicted nucleic acid-binding protein